MEDTPNHTRDVILVNPHTGMITGTEEIVLGHGPDKHLGIHLPAVISYSVVVSQGYVGSLHARPS